MRRATPALPSTSTDNTVTYNAVAPAPIAFVQVNAATPQTNQSAVTVAYTSAQLAGDTNILAIGWNNATSNITSVTDSAGNTYQLAVPTARGSGLSQAIYYATQHQGGCRRDQHRDGDLQYVDAVYRHPRIGIQRPRSGQSVRCRHLRFRQRHVGEQRHGHDNSSQRADLRGRHDGRRASRRRGQTLPTASLPPRTGISPRIGSSRRPEATAPPRSLSGSASWVMQVATFKAAAAGGGDTTAPSVTINQAAGQADPTSASPINFTVTFSETVTGFAAGDISFAGSTVGGTLTATVTGTGPTYNVAVSGMTGTGSVVVSVPAGAATDAAGNASLASTSTDNSVTFGTVDTTAPTVQSINRVGTTPTNAASVSWTVLFSESVTGVDASDFALVTTGAVTGATITSVSGSGKPVHGDGEHRDGQWDAGPEPGGQRYASSIPAPIHWAARVRATATSRARATPLIRRSRRVTINQAAGQADPTSASPINFTVTFSETVTGFAASDISFAGSTVGGTLTAAVTGTGPTYNVAVSGMTGTGTVVVSVPAGAATDAAGNASLASTSTDNTVAFSAVDTTAPTVQSINRVGTTPTNAASVSWTVLFSESVTGVDASDFALATTGAVTGATITSVSGSGNQYTVTANTGTGSGTLGLNLVDNDTILDTSANPLGGTGAGNGNFTGQSYTIDKTQPTRDDQPGGGPGGSDEREPDQLHRDLQRDGDGLCRERHQLCGQHGGRHAHGDGDRHRPDLQRGGIGDDAGPAPSW